MKDKNISFLEPKLAWRNLWKNRRRTVLTLMTIMVGCTMIIFFNAFAKGGHDQMIEDAIEVNTGHIQIHELGFWENSSIDYAFKPEQKLMDELEKDPRVEAFAPRVNAGALLAYGETTYGAMVQAVDPVAEKRVSNIHTKILEGGRYLRPEDKQQAVMGDVLAKNLGVGVGDEVAMISQGLDGSIAAENLIIVGLFSSGNPEYDRTMVIMAIERAKDTFSMMGYINSLVIRLKSTDYIADVRDRLRKIVDPEMIEVMGWDELMPELVQFIVMDDVGAYIFDFILFMVVAFGILNTIQMSVFERIREFGVMLAIGTRPGQVRAMIMYEALFITMIGVAIGLVVGSAVSYYFTLNPVDYSAFAEEIKVWGISTVIYPTRITVLNLSVTSLLTFVLAMIFSFFPARRAAQLKPIEAIRHL